MTLKERYESVEARFNEHLSKRDQLNAGLRAIEEELLRLQGEARLLNHLIEGENEKDV